MSKAVCAFETCSCKIITINDSNVISLPHHAIETFHLMRKGTKDAASNPENSDFLIVGDVWDFDNVGVSKDIPSSNITELNEESDTVAEGSTTYTYEINYEGKTWTVTKCVKYLICADCDKGPIGMICEVINKDVASDKRLLHLLSLESVTR